MEVLEILDAPEPLAYIEHEMECPFCNANMISIVAEDDSLYYRCGTCGNDWAVIGG